MKVWVGPLVKSDRGYLTIKSEEGLRGPPLSELVRGENIRKKAFAMAKETMHVIPLSQTLEARTKIKLIEMPSAGIEGIFVILVIIRSFSFLPNDRVMILTAEHIRKHQDTEPVLKLALTARTMTM